MSCDDVRAVLPVYLDGELDPPAALEVERHLRRCAACAQLVANEREFRAEVRREMGRFVAPPALAARVRDALAARARSGSPRRESARRWLPAAAAFVLGAALAGTLAALFPARPAGREAADEVLASHLRSLQADHLTDVASTDRHTVKPWFAGRLDFSPSVPDLTADGFPLAGGRLDVVAGRPAAALVYRRRLHVINVFVRPATEGAGDARAAATKDGYHLLRWSSAGMAYWAVSDVDARELDAFARLFRERAR